MKPRILALVCIAIGILIGFPVVDGTYKIMMATSTPEFCASCHEIRPAVRDWRTSSHASNIHGVVADCVDCHLPNPEDTLHFFFAKTYHGVKDYVAHFLIEEYDREKNREHAYLDMPNSRCQKCHTNILYMPYNRGAMRAHRAALYPMDGPEKACVSCHRPLVHIPAETYRNHGGPELASRAGL